MRVVENLLHLRRRQCEERRRYLAELDLLAQRLRADASRLQAEIERAIAARDPALAQPLIERHGKLKRSVVAIEGQIAVAGDALAAAERELQRHELAATRRTGNAGATERRRAGRPPRARPAAPPIGGADRGS